MTLIKICGIKDINIALKSVEFGADALGFVFAPSKRKIELDVAREIIRELPRKVLKIGVFVNESKENIKYIYDYCGLNMVQLHGEENVEFCEGLGLTYIKAFPINSTDILKNLEKYKGFGYLFDAPKGEYAGGSGVTFKWNTLNSLPNCIRERLILAGGLNAENISQAIKEVAPFMVDVSSGVETEGKKDIDKIKKFIECVRLGEF